MIAHQEVPRPLLERRQRLVAGRSSLSVTRLSPRAVSLLMYDPSPLARSRAAPGKGAQPRLNIG